MHCDTFPPDAGMLLAFVVGTMLEWRGSAWIGAVMALPLLAMIASLSDTPVYLIKKGTYNCKTAVCSIYFEIYFSVS